MTNMYSIRENILLTNKEQGEGLHVTICVKLYFSERYTLGNIITRSKTDTNDVTDSYFLF